MVRALFYVRVIVVCINGLTTLLLAFQQLYHTISRFFVIFISYVQHIVVLLSLLNRIVYLFVFLAQCLASMTIRRIHIIVL